MDGTTPAKPKALKWRLAHPGAVIVTLSGLLGADRPDRAEIGLTLIGKVVAIADGDTLTFHDGTKTQHKIRLDGIDAPEERQAFGRKATDALGRQDRVENGPRPDRRYRPLRV
jgi:endonuclease YncB( thermonuclease family)